MLRPTKLQSVPSNMDSKAQERASRRSGVQAMAQRFERRISGQIDDPIESSTNSRSTSDNIDELKAALDNERRQVIELEDELSRQCEINCSLMKEVSALSLETEVNRNIQAHEFNKSTNNDMDACCCCCCCCCNFRCQHHIPYKPSSDETGQTSCNRTFPIKFG